MQRPLWLRKKEWKEICVVLYSKTSAGDYFKIQLTPPPCYLHANWRHHLFLNFSQRFYHHLLPKNVFSLTKVNNELAVSIIVKSSCRWDIFRGQLTMMRRKDEHLSTEILFLSAHSYFSPHSYCHTTSMIRISRQIYINWHMANCKGHSVRLHTYLETQAGPLL